MASMYSGISIQKFQSLTNTPLVLTNSRVFSSTFIMARSRSPLISSAEKCRGSTLTPGKPA